MSDDFLNTFVDKPARESAGSMASNRFDYQKNWSLCELLELHAANNDFLMVFEHHEDIVVFDSQNNPSSAIFYQVKSKKSGNWTINALTKSKTEELSNSILGKLYNNHLHFPDNVKKLVFTSNQNLSTKLKNDDKAINSNVVLFSTLSNKDKEAIHLSVEPTDQDYCDLSGLEKIIINKNDLQLADHTANAKGKLVEFFEKTYPESQVHISLVYKTFFDEVRRKSNYEEKINTTSELYEHKSISRSDFESMVNIALKRRDDNDLWAEGHALLLSEGYKFVEVQIVRKNWNVFIVDRLDVENESHIQFREEIRCEIEKACSKENVKTFNSIKSEVMDNIQFSSTSSSDFSEEYLMSAILYEVLSDDSISASNKKPADEKT